MKSEIWNFQFQKKSKISLRESAVNEKWEREKRGKAENKLKVGKE